MNTNAVTSPRFGKLECAVGVLTALVLACVLIALASNLQLFGAADSSALNKLLEISAIEKHAARGVGQGPNMIDKTNASPTTPQPGVAEKSNPVGENKGGPVGEPKTIQAATQGEAQEPPAPAGAPPAIQRAHPAYIPEPLTNEFIGKTIFTVAIIFALAIITALVFVHCLFGLFRRHSQRFGPLIRIEYSGPPITVGPFTASSLGVAGEAVPAVLQRNNRFGGLQAESAGAHTAEPFDLGPTFEAQRHLKDEQAKRLEEAVLQRLFEDNLKLQAQIALAKGQHQEAPSGHN